MFLSVVDVLPYLLVVWLKAISDEAGLMKSFCNICPQEAPECALVVLQSIRGNYKSTMQKSQGQALFSHTNICCVPGSDWVLRVQEMGKDSQVRSLLLLNLLFILTVVSINPSSKNHTLT